MENVFHLPSAHCASHCWLKCANTYIAPTWGWKLVFCSEAGAWIDTSRAIGATSHDGLLFALSYNIAWCTVRVSSNKNVCAGGEKLNLFDCNLFSSPNILINKLNSDYLEQFKLYLMILCKILSVNNLILNVWGRNDRNCPIKLNKHT